MLTRTRDRLRSKLRIASATAASPTPSAAERPAPRSEAELVPLIEQLTRENRASPQRENERRLLTLRSELGRARRNSGSDPVHPEPDNEALPEFNGTLPEIDGADVTAELIRAGILRDGCLLVRGLIPRDEAVHFADQIERAYAEREAGAAGQGGYYEEFAAYDPVTEPLAREWVESGGGLLAADSPLLTFEMMELFANANVPRIVARYLGEPPLISAQKTTLRKADPSVGGAWHQDGRFMGQVRALNLWLALSRCGDEAPGLDLVPRRLDEFATAETEEAMFENMVSQRVAEESAGDRQIVRPIFEPGDALFFDDLFLHKTGSDPSMPKPRFAIENWFFGGSAFPADYSPLAV